jgi:uncharacterized protein YycO
MNGFTLHFARSKTIGGRLIRLATFSQYNHVGIQIGETIYDATFRQGVQGHSVPAFRANWTVNYTVQLMLDQKRLDSMLDFLLEQCGKPYDWRAIAAIPLRGSWHKADAWSCSELAAEAMVQAGLNMNFPSHRVTPRDLVIATSFAEESALWPDY